MTDRRERIAALIRALREKTTANGCTEGEAVSAAEEADDHWTEHGDDPPYDPQEGGEYAEQERSA